MTNLQIYLESTLSSVISSWNEKDISMGVWGI